MDPDLDLQAHTLPEGDGRIYPIDGATKGLLLFCGAVVAAIGIGFSGYGLFSLHGSDRLICVSCGLSFMAAAWFPVALALKSATVLYSDRIERRGAFGNRSIRKTDIAGYRIVPGRNEPPYMKLLSKRSGVKNLNVYRFGPDATFDDWFKDIPDLASAETVLLSSDPALCDKSEIQNMLLKRQYWIAYSLTGLSIAGCIWAMVWPHPYQAVIWIDVLLPLVGLLAVVWSRGAIAVIGLGRNEPPQISISFAFTGLVLVLRSLDYPIDGAQPALIGASFVGIALAALSWFTQMPSRNSIMNCTAIFVLGAIYGFGSIVTLDRIMDRSPVHIHLGVVHHKYLSGSRSIAYNIAIQPYRRPQARTVDFVVSRPVYDAVARGQMMCVGVHEGAFAIRWFDLRACAPI